MHVAIVYDGVIPVKKYGGTARDIWYLGNELHKRGHQVTYLVAPGSYCPFAEVVHVDSTDNINEKIPESTDIVNCHQDVNEVLNKPVLFSIHGNTNNPVKEFPLNSVFVSHNHASRFGSDAFVYNGMDWDQYPKPDFSRKRSGYHFLGKAAWKVKNLKAAMAIARRNNKKLEVLGGYRFNFKMGMRFTFDPRIHFHGMVGDEQKARVMNQSEALLFPVLWHEPMGLAVIESLYYGCPVFATPYGSLPELVGQDYGFLSASLGELTKAANNAGNYDAKKCHEYARDNFNAARMADKYLMYFEKILNGENINNEKPRLQKKQEQKYLDFYW
ncbi:MAG: glycosyltransferase [Candidatus Delongbacteria bacterium]|jgi:glycosyltransferase involved in cell wall biosynthesis|nr:glycosyltransferase [Candidatus Delongbacteria bacterium]